MGCDIHIYTEIKKNNKWKAIKVKNTWKDFYSERLEIAKEEDNKKNIEYYTNIIKEEPDLVLEGIYDGRNYDLFGILADVRNGYGFASCDTGDGFIPISEPKGLPKDVSLKVQEESDEWDCDGHSHNYFSLKELLDYNWNQFTNKRGWVSEKEYKTFLEKGRPESWSNGIGGGSIVYVSNEEMKHIIHNSILKEKDKYYYTQIEWKTFYYESAGSFYTNTIPQLKKIAEENNVDYDDIRIVFWFDN